VSKCNVYNCILHHSPPHVSRPLGLLATSHFSIQNRHTRTLLQHYSNLWPPFLSMSRHVHFQTHTMVNQLPKRQSRRRWFLTERNSVDIFFNVEKMAWGKFTRAYITMLLLTSTLTTAPCITVLHMSAGPRVLTHVRRLTFPHAYPSSALL
jgi:hypothetical protein